MWKAKCSSTCQSSQVKEAAEGESREEVSSLPSQVSQWTPDSVRDPVTKNNNSKNNGDDDEDGDDKDGDDDDDNVGVIEEATWHRPESEKGPEKDNAVTMIRILYMYKSTIMKPIL